MSGEPKTVSASFRGRLGTFVLDVAFDVPAEGVTAIFGPSGCGKTSVLRCIAGLTRLQGRLAVNGEVWQDDDARLFRPPHQRPIGYVFQEASLFPHLTVERNLLYGAKRSTAPPDPSLDFDRVVDLLGIRPMLHRGPGALSGGERQRVAVGRALLSRPRLLLMDEPLAALDRPSKEEILPYLEALHAALAIPVFYVSHDIAEVERLADVLVLLEAGYVRAMGRLADLQADPALPLLRAPDAAVTLEGRISAVDPEYGLATLEVEGGTLTLVAGDAKPGTRQRVRISASDVSFTRTPPVDTTILNGLPARIVSIVPHDADGRQLNVVAALGPDGMGAHIVARVTRKSRDAMALVPGARIYAQIKGVALLASATGRKAAITAVSA